MILHFRIAGAGPERELDPDRPVIVSVDGREVGRITPDEATVALTDLRLAVLAARATAKPHRVARLPFPDD